VDGRKRTPRSSASEGKAREYGMGPGQRARERDRGRIQTLIRDSIIELSQGGRFRLHFQLFAGKRSANTVPGTLDNADFSRHLGHRCLLPTCAPFSTIPPTAPLSLSLLFLPSRRRTIWSDPANSKVMIHCRFLDYSSTCRFIVVSHELKYLLISNFYRNFFNI